MDATFFPSLEALDFAQEGHSLEFDNDELVYKGVVFNEMKGALSSPVHNQTHIVLAWLLGDSTDINEVMNANLLSGVLLDNSASPLRDALESTKLGTAVSPLCGCDESSTETTFMCGLEGSNPEQAEAVEALILEVLQNVAKNGVPLEQVESVLHQIELSQREITGDGFPYGLRLIVNALSPMIHGGDPVAFLDLDSALIKLRQDCQNPRFIPDLIQGLLLDNPHRVRVVMAPDADLAAKAIAEETAKLAAIKAKLNDEQKAQIIEQEDDPEILPKVGLEDIADELKIPSGNFKTIGNLASTWFASGTNGMIYQKIVIDLPEFEPELLEILPLFCDILTEVGVGEQDYRQTAALQAAVTGGISASLSIRGNINDVQQIQSYFSISGKALVRNQDKLSELSEQWSGLEGIQKLKQLDKNLEAEKFAAKLARIRDKLLQSPRQLLTVSEAEQTFNFKPEPVNEQIKQAWQTNTQVNFCSKAYSTVAPNDFDAAVFTVLGHIKQWLLTPNSARTRWSIWRRSQL